MDTCFAIYKTLFDGAFAYSYDLEELASYFVEYHRVIHHWLDLIGEHIHVVNYEELVSEQRRVTEDLLDYCGLTFDEACFRFDENPEPTTTASASQVHSPMHQDSIGLWRNYEEHLEPVRRILAEAGVISAS